MHTSSYGANASVQGYLIYEQDAIIYESPSPPLPAIAYSNSAYQTVNAGNVPVFVTHISDGNNRLEWYQNGLICDFVSDQPVEQLLTMVRQLQSVMY